MKQKPESGQETQHPLPRPLPSFILLSKHVGEDLAQYRPSQGSGRCITGVNRKSRILKPLGTTTFYTVIRWGQKSSGREVECGVTPVHAFTRTI